MMLLRKERELIVNYGRKLIACGLARGTGGNLSIYNRSGGLLAISPSAMYYDEIRPEDVTVIDGAGRCIEGTAKVSSERDMHLVFYARRPDVCAVVHTHSVFATTLSCLRRSVPPIHYLMGFAGGEVPCADYATVTTQSLAEAAFAAMQAGNAVLLANHGVLTVGRTLPEAFDTAEIVEFCAELYCRSKDLGEPREIPAREMDALVKMCAAYRR